MRPVRGVDQLRGDAHATACLAHGAFEHIAHAEFAPDLLHIDGAAFVGEARVASDDEEPFDPREGSDDLLDHLSVTNAGPVRASIPAFLPFLTAPHESRSESTRRFTCVSSDTALRVAGTPNS